jgi:phosphoglycerol transferase MdoB-like AlkP superfamily enzyme
MAVTTQVEEPVVESSAAEPPAKAPSRLRKLLGWAVTGAAFLVVLFALTMPNRLYLLTPKALLQFPIEAIVGAAILLALPGRAKRIAATLLGFLLGLMVLLKALDIGFYAVLVRTFDPVFDWVLVSDGVNYISGTYGHKDAVGAVVGTIVLVLLLLTLTTLSVRRLSSALARHEAGATKVVAVLTIVWVVCAAYGQSITGLPRANDITSSVAYAHGREVPSVLVDQRAFKKAASVDAFGNTPSDQLLTGLKGKDVIFTFVESYGQAAANDPDITSLLADGTKELQAAGYGTRSAWMTSPTAGGGSFLAHSTLFSGLWINNEARYQTLVKSKRLTLSSAFAKANWRTVGEMPGLTGKWPEAGFFGYQKLYDAQTNGYAGPRYGWASTPDQYILSNLQKSELTKPGHPPVMAEVETTSSHAPWTYVPKLVDWDDVGSGQATRGVNSYGTHDAAWTRAQYKATIEYSLKTLISYVQKYGNDNLVLVFLGDHQPVPLVAGQNATHNVPITIVAKDKGVLDQINGWNWTDGLKPAADAPNWRMDAFRDRFLTAFGSKPSN